MQQKEEVNLLRKLVKLFTKPARTREIPDISKEKTVPVAEKKGDSAEPIAVAKPLSVFSKVFSDKQN